MGLSLKQADMIAFLDQIKGADESFKCQLWGTVIAQLPLVEGRTLASVIMVFTPAPGVSAMPDNAFCYIGLTEKSLYVVAVDAYNTSKIIGTFRLPFDQLISLKCRKTMLGSYVVDADTDDTYVNLTVKAISLGTDIKDQKNRLASFITEIERIKTTITS